MAGVSGQGAFLLAILFLLVGVYGFWRAKGELRVLAMAVVAICGPVILYMGVKDSDYSFLKSLMYSYYLVPLLMAAGLVLLPKAAQYGMGALWMSATAYYHY